MGERNVLHVSNLSYDTTDQSLCNAFRNAVNGRVICDRYSGKSRGLQECGLLLLPSREDGRSGSRVSLSDFRGNVKVYLFGFVEFDNEDDAKDALRDCGDDRMISIDDRDCRVDFAKGQRDQDRGGGGSMRGGRGGFRGRGRGGGGGGGRYGSGGGGGYRRGGGGYSSGGYSSGGGGGYRSRSSGGYDGGRRSGGYDY